MKIVKAGLAKQSWMVAPETLAVMAALHDNGGTARFVGGCVRNALANRKVIDIDIATPLKPDDVIERLVRHKINYAPTGLKHGTVTAFVDSTPFEITTLRRDVQTFGRHADVEFTDDWTVDASRRDFTINAMSANMDGDIFDPFDGIADLRLGRVVFVGNPEERIKEDVLRILRYFRFYAHFGRGDPDIPALAACKKFANLIPKLSAERIRMETLRILDADTSAYVWRLMSRSCGVTTHFLPEATNIDGLDRLIGIEHKYESPQFPLRRLAALLDVTLAGLPNIVKLLKLSNTQAAQLLYMVRGDALIHADMNHSDARKLVFIHGNDMARSLLLLDAARNGESVDLPALYNWATVFRPPRFPVTGEDVMKMGWKAGPDVGNALAALQQWWISEDFRPGRTACLDKLYRDFTPPRRG